MLEKFNVSSGWINDVCTTVVFVASARAGGIIENLAQAEINGSTNFNVIKKILFRFPAPAHLSDSR